MTEFNRSRWAKADFSQEYREKADIYIVERRRMFGIMKSFYRHFPGSRQNNMLLDLGCGDGIVTHELLSVDESISATLIDGSVDMLNKARERLKGFKNINYIQASFQEMLEKEIPEQDFDFIVSALAIHHLTMNEKRDFFRLIYSHLKAGGYFMNIDVILAPTETLDQWYMKLWEEWMDERKATPGMEGNYFDDITRRYKEADENKPDTLNEQLDTLRKLGFKNVDCYYKYGIFAIYGGRN
ncbi:MAG: methyltransferase domain-containing protein [Nitrospirota bacterium]|nr:methyltransferase domain-containing protein [Nitrospirota bacterium]